MVKYEVEKLTGKRIGITINDVEDFRNYKVTSEKARMHLGFQPRYSIHDIIKHLHENKDHFEDYNDDQFYNIEVFRKIAGQH